MSTYTDLHNTAKETLNVDYHNRVTPQKVHFVNPENTYHGKFIGEGHFKGHNHIDGGLIDHVYLSNAIFEDVKFKNGLKIDDLDLTLDNINLELGRQDSVDKALCTELDVEKLNRKNADDVLSIELTRRTNFEVEQSILRDKELENLINNERSTRISADNELETRVNNKMLHDRHLELVNHDNRAFPIKIKDYAVNTYIDSNPEAYVYINGNLDRAPIGRIENSVLDEFGNVKSFTFNAFTEHPDTYELTARGRFVYNFDNENGKTVYSGVGGYRLNCDLTSGKKLDEAQFILDSANRNGYYNAYFNDSKNQAAIINGDCGYDSNNHISSCLFTVTSNTLSNFIRPVPYTFDANGRTLYFTGSDGSDCEITLCDNVFYMYENHDVKYYLPAKNQEDNEVFARIYSDGFKFDLTNTLSSVQVHLNNQLGYYNLTRANGFKMQHDNMHPYTFVQYDEANNMLSVVDELIHYEYKLNNLHGTIIPGINDTINKRIDDEYTTLGVSLTLPTAELAPYVNKDYVLTKDEYSNIYTCEQQITDDNFGSIKLVYNKAEHFLKVIIKQNAYPDAHILKLFISDLITPRRIDNSVIKYASVKLCENIRNIQTSELVIDDQAKNKYIVKADLSKIEYSGESKVLICQSNTSKKNTLDLLMPNKSEQIPNNYENASSKFILNFKISTRSLDDNKFVKLNLISHNIEDKFYYTNRPVKDVFILKNKFSTLQFEEIRPHRYIITDLDYSEIDWRLKWLHNELSSHEISVYSTMMKLSDDVEFLLSTDREEMSYKGTLPFLSAESWIDIDGHTQYNRVDLSTFISQSPFIHNNSIKLGDMFKLSAAQWGVNALYDKNGIPNYLGKDEYFVINTSYLPVQDVTWSDIDIFRNPESETTILSNSLVKQISATSSYISSEVNIISSEISTELCACEISVNEISDYTSKLTLSVNGISVEVDRISSEISTELCACEISVNEISDYTSKLTLSVNGLSNRVNELCSEISNIVVLSVEDLQTQIISNDNDISAISSDLSVLEHHYYNKTMSCDLVLEHVKGPLVTDHISAAIDKLLIVDEVTFDLYALTIRNGALNINKVKTITENYHMDCCDKK